MCHEMPESSFIIFFLNLTAQCHQQFKKIIFKVSFSNPYGQVKSQWIYNRLNVNPIASRLSSIYILQFSACYCQVRFHQTSYLALKSIIFDSNDLIQHSTLKITKCPKALQIGKNQMLSENKRFRRKKRKHGY